MNVDETRALEEMTTTPSMLSKFKEEGHGIPLHACACNVTIGGGFIKGF